MSRFDIKLKKWSTFLSTHECQQLPEYESDDILVFGKFDTSPEESLSPQTSMAAV